MTKAKMCDYTGWAGEPSRKKRMQLNSSVEWWEVREGKFPSGAKRPRLTCPECKRRMVVSAWIDDDACDPRYRIPPHKKREWWKKKRRKKGKRGRT